MNLPVAPRVFVAFAVAALIALASVSSAQANSIDPGFDLFRTDPGTTFVDLTPVPSLGLGIIPLEGVPFGPGNTDTIIERLTGPGPTGVGDTHTIDIEIVALSLQSVDPVDIGGSLFDLHVSLGPTQTTGQMQIFHIVPNGGEFQAVLPVSAIITLIQINNPIFQILVPFNDVFDSQGVWSHTAPPLDAHNSSWPANGFYPGIDPTTLEETLSIEFSPLAQHGVFPAMVPLPASAWLGLTLFVPLAVGRLVRRKRVSAG
jgi:hypothetical protein